MESKYFVLPLLLATSFLTGCGNSAPKDNTAMKLVISAIQGEIISFAHNDDTDNITVNWGDGSINNNSSYSYVETKEYTITITGVLESFKYTTERKDSLISVTIGNVISLGEQAFYQCTNLTTVKWLDNVKLKEIGFHAFERCTNLESIVIPNGITLINSSAFMGIALTSIVIPSSVVEIGYMAFTGSSLQTVLVDSHSSLQTIGKYVFQACLGLRTLNLTNLNHIPNLVEDPFFGCNLLTIYVNSKMLNAFKTAEGWSDYAGIITDEPVPEPTL